MTDISFTDLCAFERDLLRALAALEAEGDPVIGADLRRYIEENGYDNDLTQTRLYHNLDSLTGRGLVEKHLEHPNRRSNSYSMTARGRGVLAGYLEQFNRDMARGMREVMV